MASVPEKQQHDGNLPARDWPKGCLDAIAFVRLLSTAARPALKARFWWWRRCCLAAALLTAVRLTAAEDEAPAWRFETSRFRDADGVVLHERVLEIAHPAGGGGAWRWRVMDQEGGRERSRDRATEAAVSWDGDDDAQDGPGRILPLRRMALALRSDAIGATGGFEIGRGPWRFGLGREPVTWWAGLAATKMRWQLAPVWRAWEFVFTGERWWVADGNRLSTSAWQLRYTEEAADRPGLFLTGYRRAADRHSPQYWSPEKPEAGIGVGLHWHTAWGRWRTDWHGVSLYPLNAATRPGVRYDGSIEWSITPSLIVGMGLDGGRGRLSIDPYWSRSARLYLTCRCLGGPGMAGTFAEGTAP